MSRSDAKFALAAAALLTAQALAIAGGLRRNAPTLNEVAHLPSGMSYWHKARFSSYHHNPPLIKLMFSLPAIVSRVPIDYRALESDGPSRAADEQLGRDFLLLNKESYREIFVSCRLVVLLLTLAGGIVVFRWSSALFGPAGGLISLALWATCPEVLAHGGLVTVDMGCTVLFVAALYSYRRYCENPTNSAALRAGAMTGLGICAKFTLLVLPLAWVVTGLATAAAGRRPGADPRRFAWHSALLALTVVVVINDLYLFDGTCRRLDSFAFRSRLLSAPGPDGRGGATRRNRFEGSPMGALPVPLPEHFVLGFDQQLSDSDRGHYYCFLGGELRRGQGWWFYYVYYWFAKTPPASLAAFAAALAAWGFRRYRAGFVDEATILAPAAILLALLGWQTGLNYGRYSLPIYPLACIFAGRLGRLVGVPARSAVVVAGVLAANAASLWSVHPFYLTYFNRFVGGPANGPYHLCESNDWGQGLYELRDWLAKYRPGSPIWLAYRGGIPPEVLGITFERPPFGPDRRRDSRDGSSSAGALGPAPGLHAVSVTFLVGIPFFVSDGQGSQPWVPAHAYAYYNRFKPTAIIANSIYVYDLSTELVDRERRRMGLPPWPGKARPVVSGVGDTARGSSETRVSHQGLDQPRRRPIATPPGVLPGPDEAHRLREQPRRDAPMRPGPRPYEVAGSLSARS